MASSYSIMLRQGSAAPRQRQTRAHRMTRHSCFTLKREYAFKVRKSLVEYVDEELQDMNTSVYYQRIYVLAKNETLNAPAPETTATVTATATNVLQPRQSVAAETAPPLADNEMQSAAKAAVEAVPESSSSTPDTMERTDAVGAPDLNVETVTQTFRFDAPEPTVTEIVLDPPSITSEPEVDVKPTDFFSVFKEQLSQLQAKCNRLAFTPDPMCGLFLYMGDYSMLMLESSEDMMGLFCKELLDCSDEFWSSNRVFLIEDHIKELYTKDLISRHIPGAFINEKFPTSTPSDEYLMGKQHIIIKEKLLTICRMIAESLDPPEEPDLDQHESMASTSEEEHNDYVKPVKSHISESLPVDVYRKLLPEIQRIDLVLASSRFYYSLADFVDIYGHAPFGPDDDGLFWPTQNNYTPAHIFRRLPFDVNLTFTDYAMAMRRPTDASGQEQEERRTEFNEEEAQE